MGERRQLVALGLAPSSSSSSRAPSATSSSRASEVKMRSRSRSSPRSSARSGAAKVSRGSTRNRSSSRWLHTSRASTGDRSKGASRDFASSSRTGSISPHARSPGHVRPVRRAVLHASIQGRARRVAPSICDARAGRARQVTARQDEPTADRDRARVRLQQPESPHDRLPPVDRAHTGQVPESLMHF